MFAPRKPTLRSPCHVRASSDENAIHASFSAISRITATNRGSPGATRIRSMSAKLRVGSAAMMTGGEKASADDAPSGPVNVTPACHSLSRPSVPITAQASRPSDSRCGFDVP